MKKKIISILLSVILCLSLATPAFALSLGSSEEESESGVSLDDILASDLVQGIMSSEGVIDITNIVLELVASYNKENIQNFGKEEATKLVQSTVDTVTDAILQIYDNAQVFAPDPVDVIENLFDLDEDALPHLPQEKPEDPNEMVIGPGDVDGDGKVTAADARLILRRAVQIISFTTEQDSLADVDKDGVVTAVDARIVLRYAAGLELDEDYGFVINETVTIR